jgi:FixJ family two-component response regulator
LIYKSALVTRIKSLIAVVDDEESVRKALSRLMRSEGFEVVSFASGRDFTDSFEASRMDCLVLDLHMPGMTGFEVMNWLAERDARLPVLVITGVDSRDTRLRAEVGGAAAYFGKPVDGKALLDAIHRSLQIRKIPGITGDPRG